jgi:hypothetical protein
MHKARTLGVVPISTLGGLCWLLVSLILFMPLMGIRHSGRVDDLVGAGSVGWPFSAARGLVHGFSGCCEGLGWEVPER